jgi:hypothetical protein
MTPHSESAIPRHPHPLIQSPHNHKPKANVVGEPVLGPFPRTLPPDLSFPPNEYRSNITGYGDQYRIVSLARSLTRSGNAEIVLRRQTSDPSWRGSRSNLHPRLTKSKPYGNPSDYKYAGYGCSGSVVTRDCVATRDRSVSVSACGVVESFCEGVFSISRSGVVELCYCVEE